MVHKDSSFYNLEGFKNGESALTPIELHELGEVTGKKMLHLQCHFGMDRTAQIKGKEYSWNHSISEVLNALIRAGLTLDFFNEYMYSPYPCFRKVTEFEKGKWHIQGMEGKIPMVYSLQARLM